jgi:phosphoglycolate phosphatase
LNWELILFDLDGTLVDSRAGIVHCMAAAFQAHGLPVPDERRIARVVGLSLELALERLLPEGKEHLVLQVTHSYREAAFAMRARPDFHEALFPGVRGMLDALRRPELHLGIATGKNLRGLRNTLELQGLTAYFSTLQTPDVAPSKPHPGMVERAIAECGVSHGGVVMIGDSTFDMEMAQNAGIPAVGVSWGHHAPEELQAAGAAVIVERASDLPDVLADLESGRARYGAGGEAGAGR